MGRVKRLLVSSRNQTKIMKIIVDKAFHFVFLVEKPIVKEMSRNVYNPVVEKDFLTVSDLDFPTISGPDLDFFPLSVVLI